MQVMILCGGLGTRLREETEYRPKPMVEIGGRPILWHIMKIYAAHGVTDFIVCLGYMGYVIKDYFHNYFLRSSDVTFKLASNEMILHRAAAEPWTWLVVSDAPALLPWEMVCPYLVRPDTGELWHEDFLGG